MKTRRSNQAAEMQQKKRPLNATALIGKPEPNVRKKKMKPISITNRNDPKKPKKPPTAFFYFLEDFRRTYQEQNPDVKSMRDIGKACGEKWKTMSFDEKVAYYDIATEKRAKFEEEMAAYIEKAKQHRSESDFDLE